MSECKPEVKKRKTKLPAVLVCVALLMFGFGFALVPLYDVMCQAFGINGKTSTEVVNYDATLPVDKTRTIKVQFLATRNANLPWKFYPETKMVEVHPGENKEISYFAENDSGKQMIVQAIPSVVPGNAAQYLKKTECFCFNQQKLASGESMKMPLIFHVTPEIPKEIHTITLSYTLFDAGKFAKDNIETGKRKRFGTATK